MMKNQKVIPFPRLKINPVPASAADAPTPRRHPGLRAGDDDVGLLLEALLESHRLKQFTGAVLSLRLERADQLYIVGEYAADLPAAMNAVEMSMLTIAARNQLARMNELGLLPRTPRTAPPPLK